MRLGNRGFSLLELMVGLALLTLFLAMMHRGTTSLMLQQGSLRLEMERPQLESLWPGEVRKRHEAVEPYWSLHIWEWYCADTGLVRHELRSFQWEGSAKW